MGRYIARRLFQLIPVFFGATFLVFAMVYAIPGDPIQALAGDRQISPSTVQALREKYNLNDPLPIQYAKYMGNLFQGDFGESLRGRDVTEIIRQKFPVSLRLALLAFAFEAIIGMAAGLLAAIFHRSFLDMLVLVSTTAVISIPVFVLGFMTQLILGVELDLLPIAGIQDGWRSYILPASVLAAVSLAYIARLLRTSLIENLRADYVRTARAKGLPQGRVIGRHALRNSLIPVVTYLAVDLGGLMGGAIVTEGIFNLPGIGNEIFRAVQNQDGNIVVGIVTALIIIFLLMSLIADLLYAWLDPRIRYD